MNDQYKDLFKTVKKSESKISHAFPDICKTPDSNGQKSIPTPNFGNTSDGKHRTKKTKMQRKPVNQK